MIRIFSDNNNLTYNNYLKNKNGMTILKNLKTKNKNYENKLFYIKNSNISSYLTYSDFLNITQTFYKLSQKKYTYKSPLKIIDLKTSFLFYNNLLHHIKYCNYCKNKNIKEIFQNCKEVKQIL